MSKTVALEYECNFSVTSVMEFLFEMPNLLDFLPKIHVFLKGIYSWFLKRDKVFKVNFQCQDLTNFGTSKKKLHDQTNDNEGTKFL